MKAIVLSYGYGGKEIKKILEDELPVLELESIQIKKKILEKRTKHGIYLQVEEDILPYLYKADVIILGGFLMAVALNYLRNQYPDQMFLGVAGDVSQIKKEATKNVMILADKKLQKMLWFQRMKYELNDLKLILPDISGWLADGIIDKDKVKAEIGGFGNGKVDTLVVLDVDFWAHEETILRILGRQVWVIDFKEKLRDEVERVLCAKKQVMAWNV